MALSYVEYPSSGSTKAFDLTFGYLSRTHVFAFVNDTLAAYTWVSPTRIELVNVPPENATIKIARLTDRVTRITTFADGQTLLSGDLNAGDLQNFYILQEIADGVADGVAAGTIVVQNPGEGYITEQWIQEQLQAAVGGSDALAELNALIQQEVSDRNAALLAEAQARAAELLDEANARIALAALLAEEEQARVQALADEASARAAAILDEAEARADAVLALTDADIGLGQRLDTVESDINTASTGLKAKVATLTTATSDLATNKAEASVVTAIDAKIEAPTTGLKARATSLESRVSTVETDKATVSSVSAIDAKIEAPTTGLNARATSLESRVSSVETGKASTSVTDAIDAKIETPVTGLNARATSLEGRVSSVETDKATVSSVSAIDAKIETPTTGLLARATSLEGRVSSVESGKASTSVTDAIDAKIETAGTGLKARATSLESRTTAVENNKAEASTVTSLSSTVSANDAAARKVNRNLLTNSTGLRGTTGWVVPTGWGTYKHPVWGEWYQRVFSGLTGITEAFYTDQIAATAGYTYHASAVPFLVGLTAGDARFFLAFYNSAGDWLSEVNIWLTAGMTNNRQTVSGVAPANTAFFRFGQQLIGATGNGGYAEIGFYQAKVEIGGSTAWRADDELQNSISRVGSAEANITTLQATAVDLTNNKAEASTVSSLSSRVSGAYKSRANLLKNSSFYRQGNDWVLYGSPQFFTSYESGYIWFGSQSYQNAYQDVRVDPGTRYSISGEIYRSASNASSRLYVQWLNEARNTHLGYGAILNHPSTGWAYVKADFADGATPELVAPAGANWARIFVDNYQPGAYPATQSGMRYLSFHSGEYARPWEEGKLETPFRTAEANITTLQGTVVDLTNNKAEASTVTALNSSVTGLRGSNDGTQLPSTFEKDDLYWTQVGGTFVNVSNIGRVYQASDTGSSVRSRGRIQLRPNRTYRCTARYRVVTNATNGVLATPLAGLTTYNSAGTNIAGIWVTPFATRTVADGWITSTSDYSTAAIIAAEGTGAAVEMDSYCQPGWHGSSSTNAVTQVQFVKLEDVTEIATANANITTLQSTTVDLTNNKANATELTSLKASVTPRIGQVPGSVTKNPAFSDYPVASGAIPPGWLDWASGTSSSRGTGKVGLYAHIQDGPAGAAGGIQQAINPCAPGKYVINIAIERSVGTLAAAGVYLVFYNASNASVGTVSVPFTATKDTRGNVGESVGYDYREWKIPVTAPAGTSYAYVYLMNHWGGFGQSSATYNQIYWHQLDVVAADYGAAQVDILKTALATESASEARLLLKVNTSTNVASIEGLAQEGEGVWNGSAISLTADKIKLQGDVIVTGTLTANEVQSNSLTKSAADVKTSSQSVTTTYADVQSITLNVPTGASLVKLDWAMRIDGRSLNANPCACVVRVLRDGTDITGDITMAALEGTTQFDFWANGVRSYDDYVEVDYVINGSFAAFALDVGASAGNRVYTLQVKKDTTGATYTLQRSTLFGVGHAR